MIKLGLTGGIGSGKSIIAEIFKISGVPVFNADDEAKKILEKNKQLVIKEFGASVVTKNELDKKKLAAKIFNDKNCLQWLNNLIHPKVQQEFEKWTKKNEKHALIVKEAAILIESKSYLSMDKVLVIECPESLRKQRVMKRDSVSEDLVNQRLNNQMSDGERRQFADFVIVNDGTTLVIPQVLSIISKMTNENT